MRAFFLLFFFHVKPDTVQKDYITCLFGKASVRKARHEETDRERDSRELSGPKASAVSLQKQKHLFKHWTYSYYFDSNR